MIDLTIEERKFLSLACAEEIDYHKHTHVTPIVGYDGKSDITDKTAQILYDATELLIKQCTRYHELIIESIHDNKPLPPEIKQESLITLCRDHLQSVEKYIVVKRQFDGTVSDKRVFPPVRDIMMEAKEIYVKQFQDLIKKLGGDPSPSQGQVIRFERT